MAAIPLGWRVRLTAGARSKPAVLEPVWKDWFQSAMVLRVAGPAEGASWPAIASAHPGHALLQFFRLLPERKLPTRLLPPDSANLPVWLVFKLRLVPVALRFRGQAEA